jgi:hypothetical protein
MLDPCRAHDSPANRRERACWCTDTPLESVQTRTLTAGEGIT